MFYKSIFKSKVSDSDKTNQFNANSASVYTTKDDEIKVVFMGDSITEEWYEQHPDFFNLNSFINRGVSGEITQQMLSRFDLDVISLQPDVVFILAGTNDIAENAGPVTLEMILHNLTTMTEMAIDNRIKVVLCSVLPAYDYPWRTGLQPNHKIPQLNGMIKQLCLEKEIVYLDFFGTMNDGNNGLIEDYTYDGVHCTPAGYDLMESLVLPVIANI